MSNQDVIDGLAVESDQGELLLQVTRCRDDDIVAFPPQRYGCLRCGADPKKHDLETVPAAGVIVDVVDVHRHRGPGPQAPFRIGDIRLNSGPTIRALVGSSAGPGSEVEGTVSQDDAGVTWIRFEGKDQS